MNSTHCEQQLVVKSLTELNLLPVLDKLGTCLPCHKQAYAGLGEVDESCYDSCQR